MASLFPDFMLVESSGPFGVICIQAPAISPNASFLAGSPVRTLLRSSPGVSDLAHRKRLFAMESTRDRRIPVSRLQTVITFGEREPFCQERHEQTINIKHLLLFSCSDLAAHRFLTCSHTIEVLRQFKGHLPSVSWAIRQADLFDLRLYDARRR